MPRWARAIDHLRRADPRLRHAIDVVGPIPVRTGGRDHFAAVCRIIAGQQLSAAAARTIWSRVEATLGGQPTPRRVAQVDAAALRGCGLSARKAAHMQDAARRCLCGELDLRAIARDRAEAVEGRLLGIRGFGPWSVEMFRIFQLGHRDVFSPGDAGLLRAMRRLYGWEDSDVRERAIATAARWAPQRSLACRYLWRWIDGGGL